MCFVGCLRNSGAVSKQFVFRVQGSKPHIDTAHIQVWFSVGEVFGLVICAVASMGSLVPLNLPRVSVWSVTLSACRASNIIFIFIPVRNSTPLNKVEHREAQVVNVSRPAVFIALWLAHGFLGLEGLERMVATCNQATTKYPNDRCEREN